jgi:hypothetical protein
MKSSPTQTSFRFSRPLRINGDQFFEDAELMRHSAALLLRKAAIYEELAISAWAKAEPPAQRFIVKINEQTR